MGGALTFAFSRTAGPPWPFLIMECWHDLCVLMIAANAGAIYTIVFHRTGAYWISLVRIGSYCFVLVPTNSHRVRVASHRIRIDSPSPPYCFVLHRIVHRTATYCIVLRPTSSCPVLIDSHIASPPFAGESMFPYLY